MDSKDEKGKGKKGKEKMTTDVAKDLASLNVGSGDDLIEADGGSSASSMNLMVPDTDDDGATEKGGHSDDELLSDTMSLASHLYRGYIENGRRYQTLREGAYWGPCDDKQFESMAATHVQMAIMDSEEENPLFRSPLPFTRPGYKPPTNGDPAGYILDIGTGEGAWAMDVAELFPEVQVIGVDLYPPPPELVPQNCIFEVDDITMDWTWKHKFDLVHIRWMIAAFTEEEWVGLYQHAYDNLAPGGWIEQLEPSITFESTHSTLPTSSLLSIWGAKMLRTNENAGRSAATLHTMRSKIESVGFTNVHEKLYRVPLGPWTPVTGPATMSSSDPGNPTSRKGVGEKTPDSPLSAVSVEPEPNWELGDGTANFNERMRDAGAMGLESFQRGAEGWVMWLLTQHGLPEPWTPEQVRLFVKRVGDELVQNHKENGNLWHYSRRVWAQKPYEEDPRRMTSASARSMTSEGSTCGETEHETTEDEGEGGADKVKKKKKRKRTKKKKKKVVEGETEEK